MTATEELRRLLDERGVEYVEDGIEYFGCYGLMDWPENYNEECRECGAFVDNMPPYARGGER